MRRLFCEALVQRANHTNLVVLTADLGFMALEPLQKALGENFINAGISEQNMLSVAAAMSKTGLETWAYSIAPFCYARPFEQIRNDIALHSTPVKIVGNGGGYGYGVMGPTHHAIEDYGILLTLSGVQACIPVFDDDIGQAIETISGIPHPIYLRLGHSEAPEGYSPPTFAPWRQLSDGDGPVVVAVGPLASTYLTLCEQIPLAQRPRLWNIAMLPVNIYPPPEALLSQIAASDCLIVAEEHVQRGSVGSELITWLAERGLVPMRFLHHYAKAHRFERYGSQKYLRNQSGLDPESLAISLRSLKL